MVLGMKKTLAVMVCILILTATIAGCGAESNAPAQSQPSPAQEAVSQPVTTPEEPVNNAPAEPLEIKRIAVICNVIGVNPFLTQIVDKFEEVDRSGIYPMEYSIIECSDIAAFGENIRAAVEEDFDLIISVGFQGGDSIAEISQMFPDKAQYVIIDTVADSPYVKSVVFRPEEAAYLIGIVAGGVSRDAGLPTGPIGGVHMNPGQGSFEWRFGYMEGARRISPELTPDDFIFNFTRSFNDPATAKELALQQAAQGVVFINAASAVSDFGTFEAALEAGFYTSGQDADRTTPDNPYIITTQVKYTGIVAGMVIDEFFSTGIIPGVVSLGLAEGAVGAVYITDDGTNPRNTAVLTDDIIAEARRAVQDIIEGRIVLTPVPLEEDYDASFN